MDFTTPSPVAHSESPMLRQRWRIGRGLLVMAIVMTAVGLAPSAQALKVPGGGTTQWATGLANGEVVINLTVTNPQAAGFLTAYPCAAGAPNPLTSNVNFRAGQTTSTAAVVK